MKLLKNILIGVVFVGLVIALLVPVSYVLRPMSAARNRITGFYAEEKDSLDVVVVGSSSLFRYVNSPFLWNEYGLTSYNYGYEGLNIYLTEYLIDEVKNTQSPKLYILDARRFIRTDYEEIDLDRAQLPICNMKYTKERARLINRVTDNPMERFNYYFDLSFYHKNWKEVDWERLGFADNERKSELHGWGIIKKVKEIERPDVTKVTEKLPLYDKTEEELHRLLKKCKEDNIEVLFLSTPWGITEDLQKKSNYMREIVEDYGFRYLDMNLAYDEIGLDSTKDFYNRKHTNVIGSEKVTKYLGDYIEANYDFEVAHDQSVTDSWNQSWDVYQKKMSGAKEVIE